MNARNAKFDLLDYLSGGEPNGQDDPERIPPLTKLSKDHGVSIASLREQLGVARALGLVEVRPRTGIRRLPYSFTPAVQTSLSYAISLDRGYFDDFSDLRRHVEANYWHQAVVKLTDGDKARLHALVESAEQKLEGSPVRLPHSEHRELHLAIFSRVENLFVTGILEAYWDAYEEVGFNRYTELDYLKQVWTYHREIVDAICEGDFEKGYQLLLSHMDLIQQQIPQK